MSEVLRDTDRLDPDRDVEHHTMVQPGDALPQAPRARRRRSSATVPLARLNHWVVAFSLIALALSGLALYTPYLYFLTNLFGGGQTTRWLHPWIGVLLFVSFYVFFAQLWRANLFNRDDVTWVMRFKDVIGGHEERLPEMGKYNAGQKFVFWGMSALILVLIVSGIVIWQEYFSVYTAIETQRWAALLHASGCHRHHPDLDHPCLRVDLDPGHDAGHDARQRDGRLGLPPPSQVAEATRRPASQDGAAAERCGTHEDGTAPRALSIEAWQADGPYAEVCGPFSWRRRRMMFPTSPRLERWSERVHSGSGYCRTDLNQISLNT